METNLWHGIVIGFLLALLAAGCASSSETKAIDRKMGELDVERVAAIDVERVRIPGSRLLRRVDPDNPHAATGASPARVYGENELEATGRTDIDDALRQLDPAVGGGGR